MKGEFILFAGIIWIVFLGQLIYSYQVPQEIDSVDQIFCQETCNEANLCPVNNQVGPANQQLNSQEIGDNSDSNSCNVELNITAQYESCLSTCDAPV